MLKKIIYFKREDMKMRKILVLNLAFLLLMILTSCNSSSSGDKEKSLHVLVEGGSPALEVAEKTAAEF